MLRHLKFMFCVLMFTVMYSVFAEDALWWESEKVLKTTFPESGELAKDIKKTQFSNLKWLSCIITKPKETQKTLSAEYEIEVPSDGEYNFYVREYLRSLASPWEYRFDSGKWQKVEKSHPFMSGTLTDLGPKDVSLVWCKYGKIKLKAGKHKFEIKVSPKENGQIIAGFDVFYLSTEEFRPNISNGWRKPAIMSKYEFITPYIWLEGEKNAENNFHNGTGAFPSESDLLSDNKWLTCSVDTQTENSVSQPDGYKAKWKFLSQMSGKFYLWIREFNKKEESPFFVKINDLSWEKSSLLKPSFNYEALNANTSVCWVPYGSVDLHEGENTLKVKFSKPATNGKIKAGIDCILLIADSDYMPHGKVKPGQEPVPSDGWFVFDNAKKIDRKGKSLFEKITLNETTSGNHGFCKVGKDGFEFGDGTKARFWGMNVYNQLKMDDEYIDKFVHDAAIHGVNLMRIKGTLCNPAKRRLGKSNKFLLDRLFYFIYACKQNGIYVALANFNPEDYEISQKNKHHPYGMLYFSKKFRTLYKKWAKFLLKENPYTQLAICDDPTVVWFEIQNGPSIFDDNLEKLSPETKQIFEKQFKKWLMNKYGDSSQIIQSWSEPQKLHPVTKKDGTTGNYIFTMFPYTDYAKNIINSPRYDYLNKRKRDQIKFISKRLEKINKELIKFLRNKCQFQAAICTGDGTALNPEIVGTVNTYVKSAGDIVAATSFVDPIKPEDMSKPLTNGAFLKSYSVLRNPFRSPVVRPIVKNKATVITETAWKHPNSCRGEGVPFVAAYSSLQGHDTYLWYKADDITWEGSLSKFGVQTPAVLGQFPGYALMFRRGDIKQGKYVLHYQLNYNDILNLEGNHFNLSPLTSQNKLKEIPEYTKDQLNPFALLVGKIDCYFSKNKTDKTFIYEAEKFKKYIKVKKGTVRSITNELKLNWQKGQLTVDTPKSQAFVGYTGKKFKKNLKDVVISMKNAYGNVLVISLDNKPIASSSHIMVQAFTRERNNGWATKEVRGKNFRRLKSSGGYPLLVNNIEATVQFKSISSPDSWHIWKLNSSGYRTEELAWNDKDASIIEFPEDTMYLELEKK